MHPQLMLLLEIQDLHLQRVSLLEEPGGNTMEADHFHIDPDQAVAALEETIQELKGKLDPSIRQTSIKIVNNDYDARRFWQ